MTVGVRVYIVDSLLVRFQAYMAGYDEYNVLTDLKDRSQNNTRGKYARMKNTTGQPNNKITSCMKCGLSNRHFNDPRKYDMHLYKECPMLTICKSCASVIDISELTNHIESECKAVNNNIAYKKCEECRIYFLVDKQYEDHMKKGVHVQHAEDETGVHSYCPLCLEDVGAGEGDFKWRKHFRIVGCKYNERTL